MTSKFLYEPLSYESMKTIHNEYGKFYLTPTGSYPSVTTVLAHDKAKKEGLKRWANRIGESQAKTITNQAALRGKRIHSIIEDYVLNKEINLNDQMPSTIQSFNQIKKLLNTHLKSIHAIEMPMYSTSLRIAGQVDMMGIWNDDHVVIDFKTSRREKYKYYITDYFVQTTMYSLMAKERYNISFDKMIIIIACDETLEAQLFVENASDYTSLAKEKINAFYSNTLIDVNSECGIC